MKNRIISTITLVIVILLLGALIIVNMTSEEDHTEKVWDERTTLGKMDAKNYYIMYTDLACPYCDAFSRLIAENEEEFKRDYIEGKDILYEVRVTEFLHEYSESKPAMSQWSAEGVYCARNEGKFWEYYHTALISLWEDYQSKGIGVSKTSPAITNMTADYWLNIGHKIGLSDSFDNCFNNHDTLAEILANTEKAAKYVDGGLPYFKFGTFVTGGFDTTWDWSYAKQYLDSGLKR